MRRKLKFGLSQSKESAPLWMQHLLSVLVILFAAKTYLIGGLPIDDTELKQNIGEWYSYGLKSIEVVVAIAMIFAGQKTDKPDTDNP